MADYKYREVGVPCEDFEAELDALSKMAAPELKECIVVFAKNLNRVACSLQFPAAIVCIFSEKMVQLANAVHLVRGPKLYTLPQVVQEHGSDGVKALLAKQNATLSVIKQRDGIRIFGATPLERVLAFEEAEAERTAMDALYQGAVQGAWTAFECLAADLWCAGVDAGESAVKNRILTRLVSENLEIEVESTRKVSIDQLGSSIYGVGMVRFDSLERIKLAYKWAYAQNSAIIFPSGGKGEIDLLSAFRNVIVHNAAVADARFIGRLKKFTGFKSIGIDDPIPLDGLLVKRLMSAALKTGKSLIEMVGKTVPVTIR